MTDWHALLGEYANELIGWAHSEGRAIIHQRKEYEYDMAVKRYCVMCLADGERHEAIRVIDGAGYCRACLLVRRDAGLSTTEDAKPKSKQYVKLTAQQRTEILAADRDIPAGVLADQYGTCAETIRNIRKAGDAAVAAAVEWMQEEQPAVSPVVHIPIPTAAEPEPDPTPFDGPGPEVWEVEPEPATEPAVTQPEPEPSSFRVLVAFDVTHEQADAIWRELPLEEKAAFVQGKLIERWNLL